MNCCDIAAIMQVLREKPHVATPINLVDPFVWKEYEKYCFIGELIRYAISKIR